jgi:predicted RNA methylase
VAIAETHPDATRLRGERRFAVAVVTAHTPHMDSTVLNPPLGAVDHPKGRGRHAVRKRR